MANTLPLMQSIPAPYPQSERAMPNGSTFGFRQPGPVLPDATGNLGFATLTPVDGFANHPDPQYRPITIIKR